MSWLLGNLSSVSYRLDQLDRLAKELKVQTEQKTKAREK